MDSEKKEEPSAATKPKKSEEEIRTKFEKHACKAHNKYRRKHGAPKLKLNRELCEIAQKWANQLVAEKAYYHSNKEDRKCSKGDTGENMYLCRNKREMKMDYKTPVDSWYNEINDYDFSKQGFDLKTGHFTQLVWKESREIGIAFADYFDEERHRRIVIANYYPVGNIQGSFEENVSPPTEEEPKEEKEEKS